MKHFSNDVLCPTEHPEDPKPWYSRTLIGKQTNNILDDKLRKMCQMANAKRKVTNHGLQHQLLPYFKKVYQRRLFRSILDLEALRTYERTNEDQHRAASKILNGLRDMPHGVSTNQQNRVSCKQTSHKLQFYSP